MLSYTYHKYWIVVMDPPTILSLKLFFASLLRLLLFLIKSEAVMCLSRLLLILNVFSLSCFVSFMGIKLLCDSSACLEALDLVTIFSYVWHIFLKCKGNRINKSRVQGKGYTIYIQMNNPTPKKREKPWTTTSLRRTYTTSFCFNQVCYTQKCHRLVRGP